MTCAHVIGGIGVGQVAVVEQRAGEQGRASLTELGGGGRTRMSPLGDGADHEVRQHAPGTMGCRVHPVHPAVQIAGGQADRVAGERHDGARPRAVEADLVRAPGVVHGELARVEGDLMAVLLHGGLAAELHAHLDQVAGGAARRAGGPLHDLGCPGDGEHPDEAQPRPAQRPPWSRLAVHGLGREVLERGAEVDTPRFRGVERRGHRQLHESGHGSCLY
jgi:hypothetical protein